MFTLKGKLNHFYKIRKLRKTVTITNRPSHVYCVLSKRRATGGAQNKTQQIPTDSLQVKKKTAEINEIKTILDTLILPV